MAVRERAAFLAAKDSKIIDDCYIHFGTGPGRADLTSYDRRLGYDSTNQRLTLSLVRESATSPDYARGLYVDGGEVFFAHTGAHKSRAVYIGGTRTAVAGGDSNDMLLDLSHTNYAVNTPAGHYTRGVSVSLTNHTSGAISNLEGAFISVRQRSTGAVAVLEGMQIDCKVDASKTAITSEISGLRVEFDVCANAPADSYGVVVRNRTDGVYTTPTAAFKVINDATSSCKGWTYGLDLLGTSRSALCDIRLASADSDGVGGMILSGAGTDNTTIAADLAARGITAAHGSVYISVVKTAGTLWQDVAGTWTQIS